MSTMIRMVMLCFKVSKSVLRVLTEIGTKYLKPLQQDCSLFSSSESNHYPFASAFAKKKLKKKLYNDESNTNGEL